MQLFLFYVGLPLWVIEVIVVIVLGALGWRGPSSRSIATAAVAIAATSFVLMLPVARLLWVNRHHREYPTEWSDPPVIICILQVVLLVAAGVNGALVHRAR
jgi:hypothetical protein